MLHVTPPAHIHLGRWQETISFSTACLASHRNSEDEVVDPQPPAAAPVPAPGEGAADSSHTSPCTNTFFWEKATRGASVCPHHPLFSLPWWWLAGWRVLLVLSPAGVTGEETRSCGGAKEGAPGLSRFSKGGLGEVGGKTEQHLFPVSTLQRTER